MHITPYYGDLSILSEDGITDAFICEAVFIADGPEGLTVLVPAAASPELPPVMIDTASDASEPSAAAAGQVACSYMLLPHGTFRVPPLGENPVVTVYTFLQGGGMPSMPSVAVNVPLDLLPDALAASIQELAWRGRRAAGPWRF